MQVRSAVWSVTIDRVADRPEGNVDRWGSAAFLDEAGAWVTAVADEAGLALTGEREQPHLRPWSSAVRFGADSGDLWFKVNAPGTRHEGRLVETLSLLEPELVPPVLAVDPERGWSLTCDAGPVMRSIGDPDRLWNAWEEIVQRYADAQVRLADRADVLLATGVCDQSAATLPQQLRELVAELASMEPEDGGLSVAEQDRLVAVFDDYDQQCAELAASKIPSSLQHDDLHSSNICWTGSAATARVIDWGDAVWAFPLATMLATLNSIAWHARCAVDDPRVLRVRDAYLEPFTVYAGHDELVRYVALARRTGCVTKALSYRTSLLGEPLETHRAEEFPVRAWLLELLEA